MADYFTGGTPSADTDFSASYNAPKAFDDNAGTRWSSTNSAFPHWIKYDLGSGNDQALNKITIDPFYDGGQGGNGIDDFKIQGSNNDSTWDDLFEGVVDNSDTTQTFYFFNETSYRYYRIYVTTSNRGDNYCSLSEIEGDIVSPTDLTLFGVATADSFFNASQTAEKAIDDDTGSQWAGDNSGFPYWWQMDFGLGADNPIINQYTIQSRNDAFWEEIPEDWEFLATNELPSDDLTTPSTTVIADNDNGSEVKEQAFDNNTGSIFATSNIAMPHYIGVDFGSGNSEIINSYTIQSRNDGSYTEAPYDWTLEASNTGSWGGEEVTLDTRTSETFSQNQKRTFGTFSAGENTTAYRYYRILVTANQVSGNYLGLSEIEFMSGGYWETLSTHSGIVWTQNEKKTFDISNSEAYRYYRFDITDNQSASNTNTSLLEVEMISDFSLDTFESSETFDISEDKQFQESRDFDSETFEILEEIEFKAGDHADTEDNFDISEEVDILEIRNSEEGFEIVEEVEINQSLEKLDQSETFEISESVELASVFSFGTASRIVSYNPLTIISDTDPVKLAKVDTTDPFNPTFTFFLVNASGETVKNAKDILFNDTFDLLYITCADGQLLKVDITDYNNREQIDTGDLSNLLNIAGLDGAHRLFIGTDDPDGEIIVLEDAEINTLSTDFRFLTTKTDTLQTIVNLTHGKLINTDIRILSTEISSISTDFRFLYKEESPGVPSNNPFNEVAISPIGRPDCKVYINDVWMDDVSLRTVRIRYNIDEDGEANFVLARKHDQLDYKLDGSFSQITSQNSVKIYIGGYLEFEGKIARLNCNSDLETVNVTATSRAKMPDTKTLTVPMSGLNEKLHPYQVLVHNPDIYDPYIDITNQDVLDNPPFYKGVKVDLGTEIKQRVLKWKILSDAPAQSTRMRLGERSEGIFSDYPNLKEYIGRNTGIGTTTIGKTALEVMNGTFKARQNWQYFFGSINYNNYVTDQSGVAFYVGSSLSSFSMDTYDLLQVKYRKQRILDDIETDQLSLPSPTPGEVVIEETTPEDSFGSVPSEGWSPKKPGEPGYGHASDWGIKTYKTEYRVGEAPYKEISARNGVFIPESRWEDKFNGLYTVIDEGYDFREYCKKIADIEYNKLKRTHGDISPFTTANIELMLDGYYYYKPSLLTRINISNTTTSNIYNNNNGFPTSVKSISIDMESCRVTLVTDNSLTKSELEEFDDLYPIENEYITPAKQTRIATKFDPNRQQNVT